MYKIDTFINENITEMRIVEEQWFNSKDILNIIWRGRSLLRDLFIFMWDSGVKLTIVKIPHEYKKEIFNDIYINKGGLYIFLMHSHNQVLNHDDL